MKNIDHVAIVGGGFSGTLLAINLLRHGGLKVTLVERAPDRLGRGLAYGAAQAGHILNVRASNMSALPDQPDHFVAWLAEQGLGHEGSFATRRDYGVYLHAMLEQVRQGAGDRLTVLHDEAIDAVLAADGVTIALRSGAAIRVDITAIAPGNLPPHDLPALKELAAPAYISDPWADTIGQGLGEGDTVLLLGSGLTAIDCALGLYDAGFRGRIIALSRRGLIPHSHAPAPSYTPGNERPQGTVSALVRSLRQRAASIGWRNAVDELRPFTPDIWRAARTEERARFLRHLRPYWDVHRHRIAPQVAARLTTMQAEGRLEIQAGKIVTAQMTRQGVALSVRGRGRDDARRLHVARIVNCTGPLGDLSRASDPLLQKLMQRGDIRADPLSIGIDVDMRCRAIAGNGLAQPRLFVVGPMTRGAHWEIVAVPDIRRQVWSLARAITAAHWVEGEGL